MFVRISDRAFRASNPTLLREQITLAYTEIDRLQDLNNNRSAEVLQLNTELQNHHTDYQQLLNEKDNIITEYNRKYNLYQIEHGTSQIWHDQYQNILSHYNERNKQNQD
jgi:hypothetical protein